MTYCLMGNPPTLSFLDVAISKLMWRCAHLWTLDTLATGHRAELACQAPVSLIWTL